MSEAGNRRFLFWESPLTTRSSFKRVLMMSLFSEQMDMISVSVGAIGQTALIADVWLEIVW